MAKTHNNCTLQSYCGSMLCISLMCPFSSTCGQTYPFFVLLSLNHNSAKMPLLIAITQAEHVQVCTLRLISNITRVYRRICMISNDITRDECCFVDDILAQSGDLRLMFLIISKSHHTLVLCYSKISGHHIVAASSSVRLSVLLFVIIFVLQRNVKTEKLKQF